MASNAAKCARRGRALNKLNELAQAVGEKYGVSVPNLRPASKDVQLESILQLEAINSLLEQVVAKPKKKAA